MLSYQFPSPKLTPNIISTCTETEDPKRSTETESIPPLLQSLVFFAHLGNCVGSGVFFVFLDFSRKKVALCVSL